MWLRLKATIVKEMLSYLRDPATRRFLIIVPILQTLVFAFAATLDVRNIDVAILDQDAGRWSHELVAQIDGAWFTDELIQVQDMPALDALISQRRVLLGVRLGPDFSRQVNAGRTGDVQVIIDGRRANAGQISTRYLQEIVAQMAADVAAAPARGAPQISLRHRYNTNLNYRWFMVVNLTAVLAMMLCLVVTSLSIAQERELGTFDQLLVSPISPLEIIIAKTFPGMMAGVVVSLLVGGIAVFVFGAPFTGSLPLYVVSLVIFTFSVVGVGLLTSAVCQTQQQAILGTFFGTIPFVMTSGFATPVENMPQWLQQATVINPLKHFLEIVQGSYFKAQPAAVIWDSLWPLLIISVLSFSVATIVVKRKLE